MANFVQDKPVFALDRVYWWQSENEYLGNWYNYAYSQNIDIYSDPKFFQLEKAFTAVTFWTAPTAAINKILRLPNNIQSNAYFSADGKIYIDSWSWPALVYTMVWADKVILNAICFTDLVLYFTAWKMHKIEFTGDDFKTFASSTEDVLTFTTAYQWFSTNESKDIALYNFKDTLLYVWAGNKLFSAGNTLSAFSTSETFRRGAKIVWLTYLNSNLKIYVNYMNVSSSLYFRKETVSDSNDYRNLVFKSVISDWADDYVVCSDGLYMFNWYSKTKLHNYVMSDFGKSGNNRYVPQNMVWLDPYFFYVIYNKIVMKFGRKFSELPYAFSISSIETNNLVSISQEMTVTGNLYYSDDTNAVAVKSSSAYKTEWYLESIIFFWSSMNRKKLIDNAFSAFEIPTNASIEIYVSINGAAYPWTPNVTMAAQTEKFRDAFWNELLNSPYNWVKIKIVLKGNGTVTPKQWELTITGTYIGNNTPQ